MIRTSLLTFLLAGAAGAVQAAQDPHAGHAAPQTRAAPAAAPDPHANHRSPPAPAVTDPHAGHTMPTTPAPPDPHAGHAVRAPADPHAGHAIPAPPADPHAGHATSAPAAMSAADQAIGTAPPPPIIRDNLADGIFGGTDMDRARDILQNEHGAVRISKVMLNLGEYQSEPPGGGYRWDLEAWYGGDLNRVVFKTEGEGSGHEGIELAETQVLYSRAIARYTDVQFGLRHDFEPGPARTYATVGFETLFPYWFEVEGAAFLSNKGDLIARLEGTYDLRLTQRLILQPQAEFRFAAQDIPELEIGSGFTHAEVGLRLRYELRREFAPFIGVSWERAFGRSASLVRRGGEDIDSATLVAGVRAWF
jgi:copper resistance protein B